MPPEIKSLPKPNLTQTYVATWRRLTTTHYIIQVSLRKSSVYANMTFCPIFIVVIYANKTDILIYSWLSLFMEPSWYGHAFHSIGWWLVIGGGDGFMLPLWNDFQDRSLRPSGLTALTDKRYTNRNYNIKTKHKLDTHQFHWILKQLLIRALQLSQYTESFQFPNTIIVESITWYFLVDLHVSLALCCLIRVSSPIILI